FTMISRITGSKGVNEYLKAAKEVKRQYPETIFKLIGPMDDSDMSINHELLNLVTKENVVELIDKVEDVKPYLKQTRIFVLPSYYPEGVPRSILEAMSMGRPIITTNSPGCRDTVVDEKNGLLVDSKNYKALVNKMIWMIKNPSKVNEMGYESRKIAMKKYDVNNVNKIMLNKLGLL